MITSEHQRRASIPIVERHAASLAPDDLERLRCIAQKYLRNEPALAATEVFGPMVRRGLGVGPALLIEDHGEIPLYPEERAHIYEYRMGLLAQEGDLIALTQRNHAFETYLCKLLGMSSLGVVQLEPRSNNRKSMSMATRCEKHTAILARLAALAREHGCLSIIPYLSTGHSWRLATAIANLSSSPVHVCAAPPRLSRRVNDKTWFAAFARSILGRRSVPPTFAVFGPAAAAGRAMAIARKGRSVIVKIPSSAGSLGNIVLESRNLLNLRPAMARELIVSLLKQRGWTGRYPILVGVWEAPVVTSPSVQTWIPLRGAGLPVIDGIFEQQVKGAEGSFVGAAPAQLPDTWLRRLAHEGNQLAIVLQELGYFGRCSFDAVLAGSDTEDAELHWIECNGRWGGVSVPLTLANRLTNGQHGGLTIVQSSGTTVPSRSMADVESALGERLFPANAKREGVVILSPTVFEMGIGAHFMAIAGTPAAADAIAADAVELLTH